MKVKVSLLGGLRHYYNGEETVELEVDPTSKVEELTRRLGIPKSEIMQVMIHGLRRELFETIGDVETIEIIPTLVGG